MTAAEIFTLHHVTVTSQEEWAKMKAAALQYAAQEARAYAHWLGNQVVRGRTAQKLWSDYQHEILNNKAQ